MTKAERLLKRQFTCRMSGSSAGSAKSWLLPANGGLMLAVRCFERMTPQRTCKAALSNTNAAAKLMRSTTLTNTASIVGTSQSRYSNLDSYGGPASTCCALQRWCVWALLAPGRYIRNTARASKSQGELVPVGRRPQKLRSRRREDKQDSNGRPKSPRAA